MYTYYIRYEEELKMTTFTNEELIEKYKRYLKLDGKSENSIYNYGQDIKNVLNHIDKDVVEIIRDDFEDYIEVMMDSGQKASTIQRRIMAIKGFYKWLELKDVCSNITDRLPLPNIEQKEKRVLSQDKIESILNKCDEEFYCYVILGYEGVCRISEPLKLEVKDVDFENNTIHIRNSKRSKSRFVPMSNRVRESLYDWIERNNIKKGFLFKRSTDDIRANLKSIFEEAGVEWGEQNGFVFHSLRHAGISLLVHNGIDIKTISSVSGTSVKILLEVYSHPSEESKAKAISVFNK